MREHRREEIFIIDWISLPKDWQDFVAERLENRVGNGVMCRWYTELEPYGEQDYQESMTMDSIKSYHKDQSETNGFKGSLDEFIDEYGLEFEVWMIEQKFDLAGIKNIYIDVYW